MQLQQAVDILNAACAQVVANRESHYLMEEALRTVRQALFPQSAQIAPEPEIVPVKDGVAP